MKVPELWSAKAFFCLSLSPSLSIKNVCIVRVPGQFENALTGNREAATPFFLPMSLGKKKNPLVAWKTRRKGFFRLLLPGDE